MKDTIYREDAINEIKNKHKYCYEDGHSYKCYQRAIKDIMRVPSAQPEKCEDCGNFNKTRLVIPQPERKKGKWISKPNVYGAVYCSQCDYELRMNNTNYCPHCGAKMGVEV